MRRALRRRAHAGREVDHVGGVGREQLAVAQVDHVAGRAEQQRVGVPCGVIARQPAVGAGGALDRRRGADLAELVLRIRARTQSSTYSSASRRQISSSQRNHSPRVWS